MSGYQFETVSPSNTNWNKRNGSSESSPTSLYTVQLTGKNLVKTLHYKHTLTLTLAHGLPSFIVTCLPIDTLLITATIVNSALIDIGTFQSRAAHYFQSQAWRTNVVLQKHRSKQCVMFHNPRDKNCNKCFNIKHQNVSRWKQTWIRKRTNCASMGTGRFNTDRLGSRIRNSTGVPSGFV